MNDNVALSFVLFFILRMARKGERKPGNHLERPSGPSYTQPPKTVSAAGRPGNRRRSRGAAGRSLSALPLRPSDLTPADVCRRSRRSALLRRSGEFNQHRRAYALDRKHVPVDVGKVLHWCRPRRRPLASASSSTHQAPRWKRKKPVPCRQSKVASLLVAALFPAQPSLDRNDRSRAASWSTCVNRDAARSDRRAGLSAHKFSTPGVETVLSCCSLNEASLAFQDVGSQPLENSAKDSFPRGGAVLSASPRRNFSCWCQTGTTPSTHRIQSCVQNEIWRLNGGDHARGLIVTRKDHRRPLGF